jgi:hypothetical protein
MWREEDSGLLRGDQVRRVFTVRPRLYRFVTPAKAGTR